MADENKPSGQEDKSGSNGTTPPAPSPDGSRKPEISPDEQARRAEQSQRDKETKNEDDSLREDVDYLRAREAERARDSFVSDLLTKEAEKFPNVKADDPLFKYATSKEEVEEIAKDLQNRFTDLQQDALRSVQTESEQSLTDEEIAEKEKELEKESNESGRSTFGSFMDNLGRRKKA